jgi:aminodeoxyfutalosine synthase
MTTRNDHPAVETLLQDIRLDKELKIIGEKVLSAERLTPEEGLILFEKGELAYLGALANAVSPYAWRQDLFQS